MSSFQSDNQLWYSTLVLPFLLIMLASDIATHVRGNETDLNSRVKLATWAYFEPPYVTNREEKTMKGLGKRPTTEPTIMPQKALCRIKCANQYREKCAVTVNGKLCRCSYKNIPFCGSDGITYVNKCWLDCANANCNAGLRIKFEGVCARPYKAGNNWG